MLNNNDKKLPESKSKLKFISSIITIIIFVILVITIYCSNTKSEPTEKKYTKFWNDVKNSKVESVEYDSNSNYLLYKLKDDKTTYKTDNPKSYTFKRELLEKNVKVEEKSFKNGFVSLLTNTLIVMFQYGMLMVIFVYAFKKIQGGEENIDIQTCSTNTFADVAGLEEIKESMLTTVDMLKCPEKYTKAGARISKGVLLYGPPGTGKTLLAKAIAGEAGVNFLAVNGADFEHKYVGVGADKVRKIFDKAKKLAPCIVFIDELDAVGCKRSGSDKSYERQTLNQLLSCMDGFTASDGIFVFAATNDIESLDLALLRPGRFDSRFAVGLPDTTKDRLDIIKLYLKNKKVANDVSIEALAKQTLGCSPASIEAIINEAAIESVKNGGIINQNNIDEAFYRQIMNGHKKKQSDRTEQEVLITAYHEAGHAIVGYLQNEDVSKISIVPTTSGAGGVTIFNQKKLGMYSKAELEGHVKTLYAGRNAEYIFNGEQGITTGASNDIKEATNCIKEMIDSYGMSHFGLLDLSQFNLSSKEMFEEYQKLSKKLSDDCMNMLLTHKDILKALADELIKKETLNDDDLNEFFKKHNI